MDYIKYMEEFKKLVDEFSNDLIVTYPEITDLIKDKDYAIYYEHCLDTYPKHFFDILYEKDTLFDSPFYIFPNVDLSVLIKENISENTKKSIWKYLQLILFFTLEKKDLKDNHIDKDELQNKIKEIFEKNEDVGDMFKNMMDDEDKGFEGFFKKMMENIDTSDNDVKSSFEDLMGGKIGKLAKEIAEETNKDIGDKNPEDFMKNMMSNPSEILGLVKNIGNKLEKKMKEGELNEGDLFSEAGDIMEKMKNMPGIKEMMKNMDLKGMTNKMEQHNKKEKTKERMLAKLNEKKINTKIEPTKDNDTFIFKADEEIAEKSKRKKKQQRKKK